MPLFEKFLPWTGALAGVLWGVQMFASTSPDDPTDSGAMAALGDAVARNYAAGFALLVGALMLVFFAAAARASARSEAHSSVSQGGLLVAAVGFGLLGILQIAVTNAAHSGDAAATVALGQLVLIGWLPALAGLVAAFWGLGLGGVFPKWFAAVTLVLGVVGVLGPLALAVYLLLPLWLIAASAMLALRSPRPVAV